MKQLILSAIGDGNGNISSARIMALLTVLGTLSAKVYNAIITKQPIEFTSTDLEILLGAFGLKIASHALESQSDKQTGLQIIATK